MNLQNTDNVSMGRIANILLILLTIAVLTPIVILFFNSMKTALEVHTNLLAFPKDLRLDNFAESWKIGNFIVAFRNSSIVAGLTIFLVFFSAGLAAYALSRYPSQKGMDVVAILFLIGMTLPPQFFLVPLYFMARKLHLTNSLLGISFIYTAFYLSFSVFFLRAYFVGIPASVEDAARIDGCSEFGLLWRIIFPLAKPAFASLAVILAMWTWNEFIFAYTFLHNESVHTVSVRFLSFTGRFVVRVGLQNAAGVTVVAPIMIFYILFQRTFIEGLSKGSFKG